jgi:SRSO17 transposase
MRSVRLCGISDKRQRASFAIYAFGLLNDGDRKSMEPIAARVGGDPESTVVVHNQLMRLLSSDAWHDEPIRAFATNYAIEAMQSQAPINTWIVDDTGMLKQGKCSPAVQRQYTGSAGKTANCQSAVSLVLANGLSQVVADARLYLPESWAADRERCRRAHIRRQCRVRTEVGARAGDDRTGCQDRHTERRGTR